jgi:TonB family protein
VTLILAGAVKAAVIVGAALAGCLLLRGRSAALRHCVLAAAIGCAAATPALELLVPSWRLPLRGTNGDAVEAIRVDTSLLDRDASVRTATSAPPVRATIRALAVPIWMSGVAIGLAILAAGLARLRWLASSAAPVADPSWRRALSETARAHGIRRPIRLLSGQHPTLLVTWGQRRPTVFVPADARSWTDDRIRVVLSHELAHIRRGDWLVQIAAEIVRAVYWFNPLLWIACRRLREESERACDDAVIALGVQGPEYATHLVDLARAFRHQPAVPAAAMVRSSSLERRVIAMLNAHMNRSPITGTAAAAVVVLLLAVTLPVAGFGASEQSGAAFSGTAFDAIGKIMPGAPLVLNNVATGDKREARTDAAGRFSFATLPAGDYLLEASVPGFAKAQYKVTLTAGQSVERDITLQLGSVQETINVTYSPTVAEPQVRGSAAQPGIQPADDPCSQSPVGGCIRPPMKLRDVKPVYPRHLGEAGTEGQVRVEGRIGTDGFVKDLRVIEPVDAAFAQATLEAINGWLFSATRLDGVAMEIGFHATVTFRMP